MQRRTGIAASLIAASVGVFAGLLIAGDIPRTIAPNSQPMSSFPAVSSSSLLLSGFVFESSTQPGWDTYRDYSFEFQVQYPDEWPTVAVDEAATGQEDLAGWLLTGPQTGEELLFISVPNSAFPAAVVSNTDYVASSISIGESDDPNDVSQCTQGQPTQVNSLTFYRHEDGEGGVGNTHEYVMYETPHWGRCYVVEYEIDSVSDPYNEFNYRLALPTLDQVIHTFSFESSG